MQQDVPVRCSCALQQDVPVRCMCALQQDVPVRCICAMQQDVPGCAGELGPPHTSPTPPDTCKGIA
eukprot:354789-Chlamydomonas_euryale.AAC.5